MTIATWNPITPESADGSDDEIAAVIGTWVANEMRFERLLHSLRADHTRRDSTTGDGDVRSQ